MRTRMSFHWEYILSMRHSFLPAAWLPLLSQDRFASTSRRLCAKQRPRRRYKENSSVLAMILISRVQYSRDFFPHDHPTLTDLKLPVGTSLRTRRVAIISIGRNYRTAESLSVLRTPLDMVLVLRWSARHAGHM